MRVKNSGKLEMQNTQLYNPKSRAVIVNGGTAKFLSGRIYSNNAIDVSGAVLVKGRGTFTMSGGTISGNNCYKDSAGVFVDQNGKFWVKQIPYITSTDEVYLTKQKQLVIEDSLSVPANYSVPLITINIPKDMTLGNIVAVSSIDVLEASAFVDMLALKNDKFILAGDGKQAMRKIWNTTW